MEKIYKDINKLIEEKRLIIDNFLLIVVTKTVNSDKIIRAIEYGIVDIAENRVLELLNRQEQFKDFKNVRYHLIGQLQTNKVKKITGKTFLIHSLDRISLLNELEKVGKEKNIVTDALIQLNISKEDSKSGIYEENLEEFIKACESCKFVKIKGSYPPKTVDKLLCAKLYPGHILLASLTYPVRKRLNLKKIFNFFQVYRPFGMTAFQSYSLSISYTYSLHVPLLPSRVK